VIFFNILLFLQCSYWEWLWSSGSAVVWRCVLLNQWATHWQLHQLFLEFSERHLPTNQVWEFFFFSSSFFFTHFFYFQWLPMVPTHWVMHDIVLIQQLLFMQEFNGLTMQTLMIIVHHSPLSVRRVCFACRALAAALSKVNATA